MKALCRSLADWLDSRTGYREATREALYENIPGGSRWIYVTGSMLVFAFVTQAVTGIFLWMFYSAGSQNAWESVFWIENNIQGGWFLRGIHHYMAQAMVVLLPLHLLQVLLSKAYVKPREMNYWLGLVLMMLTLGLGLTGYLLPWDQKGYWATKVATELVSLGPMGGTMQKVVVGGDEYGHYTLTRFFALHAGVLPVLLMLVLGLHVAMFRKHGITAKSTPKREDEYFWPKQVFKDAAACVLLLGVVCAVVIMKGGAELGPPAEPTESYGAARPEWYYLFLFQLLKHAPSEFIGAILIPGAVMAFLFLLPLIANVRYGHVVNVVVVFALLIGAGYLTWEALHHDNYAKQQIAMPEDEDARLLHLERVDASEKYWLAKNLADQEYERATELVQFQGIPPVGANASLIANDPEIQGPRIFMRNCASCHSYVAPEDADVVSIPGPKPPRDGAGVEVENPPPYGAPNLYGFGGPVWLRKIVDPEQFSSSEIFGLTAHKSGEMAQFVHDNLSDLNDEKKKSLDDLIVALAAEAQLARQRDAEATAAEDGTIDRGQMAMQGFGCTDCHKYGDEDPETGAPDLTGYGNYQWLYDFIANPEHARFYPDTNDRMPAFAQSPSEPDKNLISHHELDMLVRWLRGDDRDLKLAAQIAAEREEQTPKPSVDDQSAATDGPPSPAVEPVVSEEPAGFKLYRSRCGRCHGKMDAAGELVSLTTPRDDGSPNGAPILARFASREWLAALLDPERYGSAHYFGNTAHANGEMAEYVEDTLTDLDDDDKESLAGLVAALSADAKLPYQKDADASTAADGRLETGQQAIVADFACIDCHKFYDEDPGDDAPDLTGYGSREWLIDFISDPTASRFYGKDNDRMPSFHRNAESETPILSKQEIESIADWLRDPGAAAAASPEK